MKFKLDAYLYRSQLSFEPGLRMSKLSEKKGSPEVWTQMFGKPPSLKVAS